MTPGHNGSSIDPKRTLAKHATMTDLRDKMSTEPGYIHIDVKYLPQMADETSRRYLFVAIDRATRWVFVRIYNSSQCAPLSA